VNKPKTWTGQKTTEWAGE